ncbi:MAG: acetylornithine deacetylase [Alphaproteobacteria bacterium]|nr:acetylornithine deacetylase [Alphaproteobacteria bacterium]MBT4018506.1 acetylornithine deacetylase [Alphaproteobacteria bacterium]MBT5162160.1 acetylornithine deacetylase [Alphaproteobacteria bacterium]MBT6385399.1 acetylornithine deacetylase [Alphaproteobacteria bacterium]
MPDQTYSTTAMIERLIAFDTTSRNSNLELIHFVRDYLAGHGIESDLIHDETGEKANLYATIGPKCDGGVVLSGHTDVVPVDGQDWDSPPFTARHKDGLIYGRGTSDMKSFIAIVLALVPEMKQRNFKIPLHLAFSYDEEVGCIGAHGLVPNISIPGARPKAAIVGEPTSMRVVNAHKGINSFITTVTGFEAHSSATHQGVNAIVYAAELIGFLNDLAEEFKANPEPNSRFDPPYTSVQIGTIKGGTALNIIPRECTFVWEFRDIPGTDTQAIVDRFNEFAENTVLPKMKMVSDEAAIDTQVRAKVRGLVPENGSAAETLVMALARANQTYTAAYGTEAGIFQEAGVPTVVCGPGDIAQAHKPNEFIAVSQIDECTDFLHRLMDHAETP